MIEVVNLDSLEQSFLNEFNHTGSPDKLLDVKNHNAFRELMLAFYTEIYKSTNRDYSKIEQIQINLLKVFGIDSNEMSLNQGMKYICDEVTMKLRSRSVSINVALEKLRDWRKTPIV